MLFLWSEFLVTIWYQNGKYRAIVKDMHSAFTDNGVIHSWNVQIPIQTKE